MLAGLVNAGRSTARADVGVCQRVVTETATQAFRPTVTSGRADTALGATVEAEAVTLIGMSPGSASAPAHDVASTRRIIIFVAAGCFMSSLFLMVPVSYTH